MPRDRNGAEAKLPRGAPSRFDTPFTASNSASATPQLWKLLDQMAERMRLQHLALKTVRSYVAWVRGFILFDNKSHRQEMGAAGVAEFLTHLGTQGPVSASTQNQALAAIVCLAKQVLNAPLGDLVDVLRAKRPKRLPALLSRDEVHRLLSRLSGKKTDTCHGAPKQRRASRIVRLLGFLNDWP